MSDGALITLARAVGLVIDWEDAGGQARRVSPEALRAILSAMGLPCDTASACADSLQYVARETRTSLVTGDVGQPVAVPLAAGPALLVLEDGGRQDVMLVPAAAGAVLPPVMTTGYHRLERGNEALSLAIAPSRCLMAEDLTGEKPCWGLAVQLYALRGTQPGALGDFGALADFAIAAGRKGADAVAISPVHALFLADPGRYSPYSPSSRDHLNPLYADPALLDGGAEESDEAPLIDWHDSSSRRVRRLRACFERHGQDPRLDTFITAGGKRLYSYALFEALHHHFTSQGIAGGWQGWPGPWRDPESPAVASFAASHAQEVRFHLFAQWLADLGLAGAHRAAGEAGMRIGLVTDLAVGLDPGGSHGWSRRDELLTGIGIGAPPDAIQPAGQNWGITSFSPLALRRTGFAPFLETLRAALRHAGGVRIDHALGLGRLWILPQGAPALDGAYLTYPFEDMLRLIALESRRAGAIVIGEDLGTVPPGFRERLVGRGLLGMRVLPFERDEEGAFLPSTQWDRDAVAMTSTHDLPPVAGWWKERDIDWRSKLGAAGDRRQERQDRARDRTRLWQGWQTAGLVEGSPPAADDPAPAVDAAIGFVADSGCQMALVPVEDLLGLDEQPNLPGTIDEHPNWRRRLPGPAATFFGQSTVAARIRRLNAARPR